MSRLFVSRLGARSRVALRSAYEVSAREKRRIMQEILQSRGLMPLLMKQRNKGRWSAEDREQLRAHLRRMSNLSPYFVVLTLPGSFVVLPALAWWLDRRRIRARGPQPSEPGV